MPVGFLNDILTGCISLIYPPHCLICIDPLPSDTPQWCCARCRQSFGAVPVIRRDLASLSWAIAATRYEQNAKRAVLLLKYGRRQGVAEPMADCMAQAISGLLGEIDCLMPVPLYSARLREREFNQAELLAQRISKQTGLPVSRGNLIRHKYSPPQSRLSATERRKNIRGVFSLKHPAAAAGQRIALIDDVFTTGSTAQSCAAVLLEAGAKSVGLLAFAHG